MDDSDPELANAETIEAPSSSFFDEAKSANRLLQKPATALASSDAGRSTARRRIALVEGSAPHLSAETRALLRRRLRIVACLLTGGFAAFLIWSLFAYPLAEHVSEKRLAIFISHIGVTCILGLAARKLCAKCDLSMTALRVAEAVVFVVPALFFIVLQVNVRSAHRDCFANNQIHQANNQRGVSLVVALK